MPMARFYERYGLVILWFFTSALGIFLAYGLIVVLASWHVFPERTNDFVETHHRSFTLYARALFQLIEDNLKWFGAIATLGTFIFGVFTGIRQAKRQLPRRLVEFMKEQLQPVYDNSEALVAA